MENVKIDGGKLMKLRLAKGVNITEVQFCCGLSSGHLSRLESGKMPDPRISTIYKLAKYFQVPMESLLIVTPYLTIKNK